MEDEIFFKGSKTHTLRLICALMDALHISCSFLLENWLSSVS